MCFVPFVWVLLLVFSCGHGGFVSLAFAGDQYTCSWFTINTLKKRCLRFTSIWSFCLLNGKHRSIASSRDLYLLVSFSVFSLPYLGHYTLLIWRNDVHFMHLTFSPFRAWLSLNVELKSCLNTMSCFLCAYGLRLKCFSNSNQAPSLSYPDCIQGKLKRWQHNEKLLGLHIQQHSRINPYNEKLRPTHLHWRMLIYTYAKHNRGKKHHFYTLTEMPILPMTPIHSRNCTGLNILAAPRLSFPVPGQN